MKLLEGIVVVDFTRLLPGPLTTLLMAQAGAQVIKIEHPKRQDYTRSNPPFIEGQSTLFEALNHNKELRTIEYNTKEGREEVMDLLRNANVIIEQFRPGAMDSWGLGYQAVQKINPQLVYVSLTGYGQSGPMAKQAGHDLNYLAYSGILSLNKDERGKPVIPGVQIADIAAGSYMAYSACLSGLLQQQRSGEGCYLDVAMLDGLIPLLTIPMSQHWGGLDPRMVKVLNGGLVNYNVYECADEKWIALGALELKFWNNLCDLAQRQDWKRKNALELSVFIFPKQEVDTFFKTKTRDEWAEFCRGKDICLSPVLEIDELENHKQLLDRQAFVEFKTNKGTKMKGIGFPLK